jgi:hypothetical protein
LISDLTRIRTISEMNRSLGWGDRPRRAERAAGSQAPRSNDVARVHLSIGNATLPF